MKAAKRYAKALFETAVNNLDTVQNDMQLIRHTFETNPQLVKVVKDPTVASSKKLQIIQKVFNGLTIETQKLIELLGQKDRLALLLGISTAFEQLYKQSKGLKEAQVVTAVPLTDDLKNKILTKIKELTGSHQIKLTNTVNPDIIGGFILNLDDLRYDASVSGKLAKIKQKLLA